MIAWTEAPEPLLAGIHTVITDVDDTLTRDGRLHGATLDALDRLHGKGIRVIPATAASAGWGSLMASLWPVDAVIAENGGLYFHRQDGVVQRRFFAGIRPDLAELAQALSQDFPQLEPADDQPYRETVLAFRRLDSPEADQAVLDRLVQLGARGTVNSLWLLAWPGPWNKLTMTRQMLAELYGQNFAAMRDRILYVGDSQNDQPMFAALPYSVGVSTIVQHRLDQWPRWITQGAGGAGFVEVAERLIAARHWP